MSTRYAFFIVALILTAALALTGALGFQRAVEEWQPLGFTADRIGASWQVAGVEDDSIGLETNDVLFDELLAPGMSFPTLPDLRKELTAEPERGVDVARGAEVVSVTYLRPAFEPDLAYLVLAVIAAIYLLIGLFTTFKSPRGHAKLFFLWCLTSATLYLLKPPLMMRDGLDLTVYLADLAARLLLPALTLHLFVVFPARPAPLRVLRRAIPFFYLPALVLASLHLDWIVTGGQWFAGPAVESRVLMVDRIELALLVLFSLFAILALVIRLARHNEWESRRQVQWIVMGMLGGYLPFFGLYVVPLLLGFARPQWLEAVAVVPLALVPLTFAYAILKYKLWDIAVILRNSIAYSLTVLVGLFGFVLINLAVDRGVSADLPMLRNLLSFAAGLTIAGVLVPTKGAITRAVEHLQLGGAWGKRRSLIELGRDLSYERDLDRLCETLIGHLGEGLEVDQVNLYLAQGGAMVPVHLGDRSPRELPFDTFDQGFWVRPVTGISALHAIAEEPDCQERLFIAGYRYAFPLLVRDRRVGVAVVSYKADSMPLSTEDVDLARGLLNQAALAIENAQLIDEVNRQLDEVVRLKEHNHGIIESSPAGIAVLDVRDRVISANHAFAALVETDRPLLPGRQLLELLPVTPLPAPGKGPTEVSYCEPDGRERYLQLSVAGYRGSADPEEPLRVLVIQDVSALVGLELALKEKERLASLGMLAAGVAHEVNTPLTGISSYAQLLLDETPREDPRRELLEKMERQTFRASQIVNNLLAFARNRRDETAPLALESVAAEAVEMLRERAIETKVDVALERPAEPLLVDGNEGELGQVFTNLITNALDAMSANHDRPRRLRLVVEPAGHRVRALVEDTGPGIPAARLETVFQPFFSSKIDKGGSGLGLAICYQIVHRHGGQIRAENTGNGCRFVLELPRSGTAI
ncbi:MAG: ATP-binding protein [Acidobacteriota bacterium]